MHRKHFLMISLISLALIVAFAATFAYRHFTKPTDSDIPQAALSDTSRTQINDITNGLDTPWSIDPLPDGRLLVSERGGTVRIIGQAGQQFTIADVTERGEGGLLGTALHPDFAANGLMFIYKTSGDYNIVERYRLAGDALLDQTPILRDIPAASTHNGGVIRFGPDDKLYIGTGDAAQDSLAQDRTSLAGKILRINEDGSTPDDNPFNSAVWSYGHRNVQGLAWDDQGRLWATEHGPSGLETGNDELNLISKGSNYGWPLIRGAEQRDGLVNPAAESGNSDTWAPAGLAYADGALYFAGLRSQTLYKAAIDGDSVSLSRHLVEEYGRLRSVALQGSNLLVGTSNKDGRGTPQEGDDRILKVPLSIVR